MEPYKILRYLDWMVVWMVTAGILGGGIVATIAVYGKGVYLLPPALGCLFSVFGVIGNYVNIRHELGL